MPTINSPSTSTVQYQHPITINTNINIRIQYPHPQPTEGLTVAVGEYILTTPSTHGRTHMPRRRTGEDTAHYQKETIEQFLARGGRIRTLPSGLRTADLEEQQQQKKKKRTRG
jgi:hypothetical protein